MGSVPLVLQRTRFSPQGGFIPDPLPQALFDEHPQLDLRPNRSRVFAGLCANRAMGQAYPCPLHLKYVCVKSSFNVNTTGDWERWLSYFLRGVSEQAEDALRRVRHIRALQDWYRRVLRGHRESANAIRVVEELFAAPMTTIPKVAKALRTRISSPGARRIVGRLVEIGIITELEGRHPRLFVAQQLLDVLQAAKADA